MALSNMTIVSDGNLEFVSISFNYLDRSEISVYFDSVPNSTWAWVGDTNQIKFTPKVPNGVTVLIARMTDASDLRHVFSEGAAFTAQTLDEDLRQVLHIVQEAKETNLSGDFYSDIDMHGFQINNLGTATDDNHAVSLGQYRADVLGAGVARNEAEGYRDQALAYRNQAEGFKNTAQSSATTATTQAGIATTQAGNASISASDALSYRNTALTYRNEAQGFRNAAENFKDDAEQAVIDAANASRLTIGTVTTGSPGTNASANISGSAGSQVLGLTIPRGDPGPSDHSALQISGGDLDTILTPLEYRWTNAGTPANAPNPDRAAFMMVVPTSGPTIGSHIRQIVFPGNSSSVYTRHTLNSGSTWTSWARIYASDTALPISAGGTGSTSASAARTALGLGAAAVAGVYTGGSAPSSSDVMSSSPTSIELNYAGSGNRASFIDFHSRDGTDYDARIIRASGASGDFSLTNTNGSVVNTIDISATNQLTSFNFASNSGVRVYKYSPGGGGSAGMIRVDTNGTTAGTGLLELQYNGVLSGSITVASSSSVAFNTTSDHRLKEDAEIIEDALVQIGALRPYNYKWKSDGSPDTGFFAHELQDVLPHVVTGSKDKVDEGGNPVYQQVDYSRLVPLLVKGIQELMEEVDDLNERLTVLGG